MQYEPIPQHLEELGKIIVQCCYDVNKNLGPGLLERVYETCFCYELSKRKINFQTQVIVPIKYDNITLEDGLRLDVLVENEIICELKAVEVMNPIWETQLLTYLKLSKKRLGYLINFNVKNIGNGIKRYVK
ncbi:MAG: GxxExxY protein [Ignavibacteria bacterium]|nr:GxxExxY protein [Ignavibacteria bacterium]